nr:hypothetical protein [Candidatus Paceibacterota bacterium]
VFRGRAYPGSKVTVLKEARIIVSTVASPDGTFDVTAKKITPGTYTFSVYGTDKRGVQSATHAFTVAMTANVTNIVSGIFLPPTMTIDKKEVRWGEVLVTIGQTNPSSEVTIFVNSEREVVKKVFASADGSWLLNFDTTEIERGNHSTQSRAAKQGEISPLSKPLSFKVGDRTVYAESESESQATSKGDVNGDSRVNLVDFSVVAYWFKRANPPATADLNGDGQVTLVDFSILAYNWNG